MNREVEHVLCQSQTVRGLIEELESLDQDARVLFTCNYGDYHGTEQALPITEIVECQSSDIAESGYSQSGVAFTGDENEPDEKEEVDEDEHETVVLLRHN